MMSLFSVRVVATTHFFTLKGSAWRVLGNLTVTSYGFGSPKILIPLRPAPWAVVTIHPPGPRVRPLFSATVKTGRNITDQNCPFRVGTDSATGHFFFFPRLISFSRS